MSVPSPLELLLVSVYESCLFLDDNAAEELGNFEQRIRPLYNMVAESINSRMKRLHFFYCIAAPARHVTPEDIERFYYAWRHGKDGVATRKLDVLFKALAPQAERGGKSKPVIFGL